MELQFQRKFSICIKGFQGVVAPFLSQLHSFTASRVPVDFESYYGSRFRFSGGSGATLEFLAL